MEESKICQRLLEEKWCSYDLENVPQGIEGIYVIGIRLSGVRQWQLFGEPTVLYVGRTKDVQRRLGKHKNKRQNCPQNLDVHRIQSSTKSITFDNLGRTNDVQRRLGEHKRQIRPQNLEICQFIKEEFKQNGGKDLRVKWIKAKNEETVEKQYIEYIARTLGYWPKYNIRR